MPAAVDFRAKKTSSPHGGTSFVAFRNPCVGDHQRMCHPGDTERASELSGQGGWCFEPLPCYVVAHFVGVSSNLSPVYHTLHIINSVSISGPTAGSFFCAFRGEPRSCPLIISNIELRSIAFALARERCPAHPLPPSFPLPSTTGETCRSPHVTEFAICTFTVRRRHRGRITRRSSTSPQPLRVFSTHDEQQITP